MEIRIRARERDAEGHCERVESQKSASLTEKPRDGPPLSFGPTRYKVVGGV